MARGVFEKMTTSVINKGTHALWRAASQSFKKHLASKSGKTEKVARETFAPGAAAASAVAGGIPSGSTSNSNPQYSNNRVDDAAGKQFAAGVDDLASNIGGTTRGINKLNQLLSVLTSEQQDMIHELRRLVQKNNEKITGGAGTNSDEVKLLRAQIAQLTWSLRSSFNNTTPQQGLSMMNMAGSMGLGGMGMGMGSMLYGGNSVKDVARQWTSRGARTQRRLQYGSALLGPLAGPLIAAGTFLHDMIPGAASDRDENNNQEREQEAYAQTQTTVSRKGKKKTSEKRWPDMPVLTPEEHAAFKESRRAKKEAFNAHREKILAQNRARNSFVGPPAPPAPAAPKNVSQKRPEGGLSKKDLASVLNSWKSKTTPAQNARRDARLESAQASVVRPKASTLFSGNVGSRSASAATGTTTLGSSSTSPKPDHDKDDGFDWKDAAIGGLGLNWLRKRIPGAGHALDWGKKILTKRGLWPAGAAGAAEGAADAAAKSAAARKAAEGLFKKPSAWSKGASHLGKFAKRFGGPALAALEGYQHYSAETSDLKDRHEAGEISDKELSAGKTDAVAGAVGSGLGFWGGMKLGALAGGVAGSAVPIIGNVAGAIGGGIIGGALGMWGGDKIGRGITQTIRGKPDTNAPKTNSAVDKRVRETIKSLTPEQRKEIMSSGSQPVVLNGKSISRFTPEFERMQGVLLEEEAKKRDFSRPDEPRYGSETSDPIPEELSVPKETENPFKEKPSAFGEWLGNIFKSKEKVIKGTPMVPGTPVVPDIGSGAKGAAGAAGGTTGTPVVPDIGSGARGAGGGTTGTPVDPGSLSIKYESGKQGSSAVGWDKAGGTSYGKYQITSAGGGTMKDFMAHLKDSNPEAYERLSKAGPADAGRDGKFAKEWKALSAEGKIQGSEKEFIKKTHYDVGLNGIKDKGLRSMVDNNPALQNVVFSTSVQHGGAGASSILNKVYKPGMSQKDLIDAVYAERNQKKRFSKSTDKEFASVSKRLDSERVDAQVMAAAGSQAPITVAEAKDKGLPEIPTVTAKPEPKYPEPGILAQQGVASKTDSVYKPKDSGYEPNWGKRLAVTPAPAMPSRGPLAIATPRAPSNSGAALQAGAREVAQAKGLVQASGKGSTTINNNNVSHPQQQAPMSAAQLGTSIEPRARSPLDRYQDKIAAFIS